MNLRRMAVLVFLVAVVPGVLTASAASTAACQTSGPAAGAYTATVCISAPTDGALLTGPAAVSATVTFAGTPPTGIQRVIFALDGQYLLTDYSAPYTFTLNTARFVDGAHTLTAEALMRDTFASQQASIGLQLVNGVTAPPVNARSFTPTAGTNPAPGRPFVLAAAGDGAGGEKTASDAVSLINSWNPNLFLYLGDVYEKGTPTEYENWYAPPGYYGDLRSITDPTPGNHEYTSSPTAAGYFDYWDNAPHYFSVDAGGWHIISIDANGVFGQTAPGTAQYQWLANDLATRSLPCTLVYYHQPRFNIGQEGDTPSLQDVWALMAQNGVDVVLNGHDHTYQRWQPLDANGNAAPGGITEFVTGTGGHAIGGFVRSSSRIAATATQFGALRMDLRAGGGDWRFVTNGGTTLDSGALQCSGTAPDTTPPTTPGALSAQSPAYNDVELSWTSSDDNVGIAGYDVYRDGVKIGSAGLVPSYSDRTVDPATTYTYAVVARDPAGNVSPSSANTSVTTQMSLTQFNDDFETGNLAAWTTTAGMSVQGTVRFGGLWAAEAASTGTAAFASATLGTPRTDLYFRSRFYVVSQGANPVNLLKLKTPTGGKLCTLLLGTTGKLSYRNDQSAVTTLSTTVPTQAAWHKLELHVVIAGAASTVEIWLDDVKVPDIGGLDALGFEPAGMIEIGDSGTTRTYDVVYDNVRALVSTPVDTTPPTAPTGLTAAVASGPEVDLAWQVATDNIGVTGYDVFRDGSLLTTIGATTTFADKTVAPHTTYSYQVRARDLAGNASAFSDAASAAVAALVSDGFESGGLAAWTSTAGVVAQQAQVFTGVWGARATSTGAAANAFTQLTTPRPELYYRLRFKLLSQGANSVALLRFRTATGAAIATTFVSSTGKLGTRSDVGAVTATSTTTVSAGAWHELQVHALVGDPAGKLDVWFDGVPVADLSTTPSLGAAAIGRVEFGDSAAARSFDVAFDDVLVDTLLASEALAPTAPAAVSATALAGFVSRVAWSASTDNVGVTGYAVYRDGARLVSVDGATLSYVDTGVEPGSSHTYTVTASDGSGNVSAPGGPASLTQPAVSLFADGFESGDLSRWSASSGLLVQQAQVATGAWAARATSTAGTAAWANRVLDTPQSEVFARVRFKTVSQATTANVLKLRQASGGSILTVYVASNGEVGVRNEPAAISTTSTAKAAAGVWHTVVVRLLVDGAASQVETWLDGGRIDALSKTDAYGTNPVGKLEVGEVGTGRTFDIAFDDAAIDGNRGSDRTPPLAPSGLTASSPSGSRVDLGWQPATDNIGVAAYDIYRNGAKIATTAGSATTYSDTTVSPRTSYTYQVQARDAAGNLSPFSNLVAITTGPLFSDGFESGTLAAWTTVSGLAVQQQLAYAGTWAARATSTGAAGASAFASLGSGRPELYYRLRFQVVSKGANPVNLMRFRSPTGTALGTASISASGKLVWRNDVSAVSSTSTTNVTSGIWHELVAHVLTGAAPLSEVWLDGLKIDALTRADTLGTSLLGRIELGDPATARTFDVAFDEVSADPAVLGETTPPTAPTNLTATAVSGTEIALSWTAATDNVGVDRYTVIRDGSPVATVTAPTTTFTDTGLQPATSYTYTVLALDAAGNASPTSNSASATTRDTVPPTAPSGLAATVVSGTRIDLAWSASTDNVAVTGYRVYRNGVQVGVAATTSYSDTSVAPATSYSYTVTAVDAAGNESAASNAAVAGTPDTIAPSAPTGLTATPASPTRVDLAWTAATDNVGVTGYAAFRDGSRIATLGPVTAYSDLTGLPATAATYAVRALDAAGNVSDPSATATATTPGTNVLSEGFEAGSLAGWSATGPFSAQQQEVFAGVWAARAAATGSGAFANRTLPSPLSSLYVRARFKVVSLAANAATVLKVRTGSASVLGLFLDSSSRLGSRNDAAAITTQSSALVGPGWHLLLVRAVVGGAASETEVWLDGVRIDALARTDSLGTTAISRVELGDRTTGRTFDIAFDDVVVTSP